MESKHSFLKSFVFAFEGLWTGFWKGRNFRVQVVLGVAAVILAVLLKLSTTEWVLLLLTINFVLMLELINTSIEAVVDLVSPEIREKAKVAKDTAVAAVLISSIFSILIACFLFLPKIFNLVI